MARMIGKLSAAQVRAAEKPGLYSDGAGLYLHVGPTGGKSWIYKFMIRGRAREMGLGAIHTIPLGDARKKATENRRLVLDGIDPLDLRSQKQQAAKEAAAREITFRSCAERYITANKAGWTNLKHSKQWVSTLETYVYPAIGDLSVGAIETAHVTKILQPIWAEKTETASRLRGRIETVLDFAKAHQWRAGDNPARWRGHLENLLPKAAKVRVTSHHAALPWQQIGEFMSILKHQDGVPSLALRFAVLTACRSGEVLGALWGEIDLQAALWTIPADRMKAAKEHRVPLSDEALAVLREAAKVRQGDFVFPGEKVGKPPSNGVMMALLKRLERPDLTVHGLRSTFRDWCGDNGVASDIAEMALAHAIGSAVEAAYRRGDLLDRRRRLMAAWATHCATTAAPAGNVVQFDAR
jgi:integrase